MFQCRFDMDWARAIEINQTALARIVAALIAMVGLQAEGALPRLPRPLYRTALSVLRPVESAVRRLIVIAARGLVVKPQASRPMPAGLALGRRSGAMSFQLFDQRKRFHVRQLGRVVKVGPRVLTFGASPLVPLFQRRPAILAEPTRDDGEVNAERLGRRLQAVKSALENLPRQAHRLARWQARRDRMTHPKFRSPLRQGLPPGHRKEPKDEVDFVLRECHALARDALREDSS
jgi:hypothetical protein